jgi:hypothetical protein
MFIWQPGSPEDLTGLITLSATYRTALDKSCHPQAIDCHAMMTFAPLSSKKAQDKLEE